jgi:MFS family permease
MVLIVTSLFFIVISGRMVPAMALITSTAVPQNRGSFMSFNSSVQQLTAGIAAFIAGGIVTENSSGQLVNYNIVGYIAIVACIVSIWAANRIVTAEDYQQKLKIKEETITAI